MTQTRRADAVGAVDEHDRHVGRFMVAGRPQSRHRGAEHEIPVARSIVPRTTRTLPLPSTETFYQGSQGQLGFNAYRLRRTEAIGKHWCLVFVVTSLLHLTCLPIVADRTKGLLQTL